MMRAFNWSSKSALVTIVIGVALVLMGLGIGGPWSPEDWRPLIVIGLLTGLNTWVWLARGLYLQRWRKP